MGENQIRRGHFNTRGARTSGGALPACASKEEKERGQHTTHTAHKNRRHGSSGWCYGDCSFRRRCGTRVVGGGGGNAFDGFGRWW